MARVSKASDMSRSSLLLSAALLAVVVASGPVAAQDLLEAKVSPRDERVAFEVDEGTSMAVSVSPDGRQAVIDLQGSLWVLPAGGGKATRITDLFNDARQPVWSPDGKTIAYFAYRDGGYDLWAIAPDGSNRRKLTSGAFDDRDPAWSPDGTKIAFASDRGEPGKSSYDIWTLDLASGRLEQVTSNPAEDRLPTWSADGRTIAFSTTHDGVSALYAVDLATRQERELRRVDGKIDAPSFGPGGQLPYVVQQGTESRLEIDGKPVSGAENVFPFRVSWLPGGQGFYYVSDGKIRRRDVAGGKLKTSPFTARLEVVKPVYDKARRDFDSTAPRRALGIVRPALSPDGTQVAFAALGDLHVSSVKDGTATNLTKDAYVDTDPAWSPDGKRLVYVSDKGGGLPQLWIRDLAAGTDKRLTSLNLQPLEPVWSPDGKSIAYIDLDGQWGTAGVAVVDVATGVSRRISGTLGQPGRPSWSADGRNVAISLSLPFSKSFREGTNQVFVLPADGKGEGVWRTPVPNLSIDTRGGGGPVWSPDGGKMAAIYEGTLRVWPVSADGEPLGPPRTLTREIAHNPSWAADSRTILFQSNDRLKTVDIETGAIAEVPLTLSYTLAKPQGRVVVHAGRLVDAIKDETQHDVDIVIEANRIVDVRPHDPALHAGAKVVDGSKLTAIPGLIDYHAHVQKDFGANVHKAWLAFGVTTVRDPGNQPYHGVEDREASEAGVRIGPRIYTTGNLLEWQRVYYKMGVAVSGPAHLELELERAKALKFDLLKSYVRLPDLQQRRLTDFAHNAMGVPVGTHEVYPAAFVGVDATEHIGATSRRGYSPKQGPLGRSYADVINIFGRSGRSITPTNFGALTPYLKAHPELRQDPRIDLYPGWAQDSVRVERPARTAAAAAGNLAGIKALFDAGAKVVAGTDSQVAINLHAEIASYVDAGLTPFQALQSATATPAGLLGLDAGVIAKGKLADIVLVDGDPREDIANAIKVRQVISNGRVFDVGELIASAAPVTGK